MSVKLFIYFLNTLLDSFALSIRYCWRRLWSLLMSSLFVIIHLHMVLSFVGGITIWCFITFSLISSMIYFDKIRVWDVKHHFTCCKCCSFTVPKPTQWRLTSNWIIQQECLFTFAQPGPLWLLAKLHYICRNSCWDIFLVVFYFVVVWGFFSYFHFIYIQTGVHILVVVIIMFQLL